MGFEFLIAICATLVASALTCAVLSRYRGRWALLDVPNDRSLHADATPRSGGLGILAGLLAGYAATIGMLSLPGQGWTLMALLLTACVSLADDVWRLPPLLRFMVHLAAALMLVFPAGYGLLGISIPGFTWHAPTWVLEAFSVLLIIWMVNLYNFMDGMDGFAGGMACIGFATLALLGILAGAPVYALSALLVCAAAAGFLPFNFPPARLFMGDLGSGSLGFLVALFLLWAERAALFPLWLGGLVFSPFIVDATWTVIRRIVQGKRPWQAHREHFYQRLVRAGWGHRRTVLWSYILMLKCCLIAVLCFHFTAVYAQGIMLGLLTVAYIALITGINAMERRHPSH